MIIENISVFDQELYLMALNKLSNPFSFDVLLNEIHLRRPNFQRKTLHYRLRKWKKAKIVSIKGWGKSTRYTCLIDEATFTSAKFICTEKPVDISKNPFIIT